MSFSKCGCVPVAVGGVLADAAPDGIDELACWSSVRSAPARLAARRRASRRESAHALSHASGSLLRRPQPPCFVVPVLVELDCSLPRRSIARERRPRRAAASRRGGLRRLRGGGAALRRPCSRRPRSGSRRTSPARGSRGTCRAPARVRREDHRRRPAPLAVALLEVGARVDVDLHGDEVRVEELAHARGRGRSWPPSRGTSGTTRRRHRARRTSLRPRAREGRRRRARPTRAVRAARRSGSAAAAVDAAAPGARRACAQPLAAQIARSAQCERRDRAHGGMPNLRAPTTIGFRFGSHKPSDSDTPDPQERSPRCELSASALRFSPCATSLP